eukprot:TRINITY_DN2093_c0_g1_i1.p1 TRINITY_DN2093_c0_g1~~TRINITY_DN2093_c0_g1_i1.p1  ORF type:complete len:179 (+),score=30.59 TRINITY_DN2093_c0_g1_i1:143-679(+)
MSSPIIYTNPLSQPARAVLWFALLNNIPHEKVNIDIAKGETRSPEFLAINPLGHVPTWREGEFVIDESASIVRYLAQTRKIENQWFPGDAQERAQMNRYLDWHLSNLRISCSSLFQISLMGLNFFGFEVEKLKKLVRKHFRVVERVFLSEGKWIGNLENPSFADLQFYCEASVFVVLV